MIEITKSKKPGKLIKQWVITCLRRKDKEDSDPLIVEPHKLMDLKDDYKKYEELGRDLNRRMGLNLGLPPINMMKITGYSEVIEEPGQITVMSVNEQNTEAITLTIFVNEVVSGKLWRKD